MSEPVKLNDLIEDILKTLTEVNESLARMAEQDSEFTAELEKLTK
jgi:hypothetical protein